jgi:hypothetical protein
MKVDLGGWSWAAEMAIDWGLPALATAFGVPGPVLAFAISKLKQVVGLKPSASEADVRGAIEGMDPGTARTMLEGVQSEVTARYAWLTTVAEVQGRVAGEINKTMRAEVGKVSWWLWRHLLGYVLVLLGLEICLLIPLVVIGKITAADMAAIIAAMSPVTATFAMLLGAVAIDTTNRYNTAMTGERGAVANAVKAILPARKK